MYDVRTVNMDRSEKANLHIDMHSAVARDNDVCKSSDPWRRHTNLCSQAETDMITTDEDVKMEDKILMLYSG